MKKLKKKINLLLINPWIYDFTAYDFWSKPLGLLYLAGLLRAKGFNISYIDCMDRFDPGFHKIGYFASIKSKDDGRGPFYKEKITKPELLKNIPRNYCRYGITEEMFQEKLFSYPKPDVVLITSIMTYWYPGVFRAIELIKKYYPDCPIILGGIYATLCSQHAQTFSLADYVLKNSQLRLLVPLLQSITGECLNHNGLDVSNFGYRDCYSYPAWDLYPVLNYVCLLTSRGCPLRCSYCASYLLNPGLEFCNPYQVMEEIIYWKEIKGVNNFVFYDDALLVNAKKHIIPLLKEIKKRNPKINFYTPNAIHTSLINPQIAQLMRECGFKKIWLSLETSDPKLQRRTGNKVNNSSFIKTVNILLKEGFSSEQIRVYLLIGLPGQNLSNVTDSVNFVIDNGIKPYLAKYSPIPGTKIWKQIIKEYQWQEPVDPLWHNDALMPYFSPYINYEEYQQLKMLIQNSQL